MEEGGDGEVFFVDFVLFHFLLIPMLAYSNSSSIVREEVCMGGLVDWWVLARGSWVMKVGVGIILLVLVFHSRWGGWMVGGLE